MNKRFVFLGSLMALALTGCQQESARSYSVPKEDYSVRVAAPPAEAVSEGNARPHVHWELPKGWEETKADRMSVGRFRIAGADGKVAEAKIVPLPGKDMADMEGEVLKMWAAELGLPESAGAKSSEIEAAGLKGKFYEMGSAESRMLTAVLRGENTTWFVKLSGAAAVVSAHEAAFKDFLKSLELHEGGHDEAPAAALAKWPPAEGWTAVAPGQMVLAAYSVGGKANVTVTSFPGDVGGMFANINRWRGQMGLSPISEAEVSKFTKEVTLADGTKATAVEIAGGEKLTYSLVVRRAGATWFYKILGEAKTVAGEKERLAEFAARAK